MVTSLASIELSELFKRESAILLAYARRKLSGTGIDPEDLVQESFAALTAKNGSAKIESAGGYLRGTLDHLICDALQQKYRRQKLFVESPAEDDYPCIADASSSYETAEKARILREALGAQSSPRHRRFLRLEAKGYKSSEIAEFESAQGRPTTAHEVSCVLARAHPKLRKEYLRRGGWAVLPLPWSWRAKVRQLWLGRKIGPSLNLDLSQFAQLFVAAVMGVSTFAPAASWAGGGDTRSLPAPDPSQTISQTPEVASLQAASTGATLPATNAQNKTPTKSSSPVASLDLDVREIGVTEREQNNPDGPPFQDQILEAIDHPETLIPSCGGLPVCPGP